MAENATVIPGLYRADLQGLTTLGAGLAEFLTKDRRTIQEGLKVINDPKFMEDTALGYESALFKDMQNIQNIAGDANAVGESSRYLHARMLAAGLDPTNPKHLEAAMPVLEAARMSLTPSQRTQARLSVQQDYLSKLEKLEKTAVTAGQTSLESKMSEDEFNGRVWQLRLAQGVAPAQVQTELAKLNDENYWLEMQRRFADRSEELANKYPVLAALLGESREGFREGILQLMAIEARAKAGAAGMDAKDLSQLLTWRREELAFARQLVFEATDYASARAAADNYNNAVADTRYLFEAAGLQGQRMPTEIDVREEKKGLFGRGKGFSVTVLSSSPEAEGPRPQAHLMKDRDDFSGSFEDLLNTGMTPSQIDDVVVKALEEGRLPVFDLYSQGQLEEFWQWIQIQGLPLPKFLEALEKRYEFGSGTPVKEEKTREPRNRAEEIIGARFGIRPAGE
jgi:hypothetical protein